MESLELEEEIDCDDPGDPQNTSRDSDEPGTSTDNHPDTTRKRDMMKGINIYTYDEETARAFQGDCEALLLMFKEKDSFEFKDFAEAWREMGFSGIFEGQELFVMLESFVDICFFVAKKFLFASDINIQIGAIYLLYGLYFKQPIRQFRRIRLLMSEVEKIHEILEIIVPNQFHDVLFVYNKLRLDGAFRYVATSNVMGGTDKFVNRQKISLEPIFRSKNTAQCLNDFRSLMEDKKEFFQEMHDVDSEYQELMKKYSKIYPDLVPSKPSQITSELRAHYSALFGGDAVPENAKATDDPATTSSSNTTILQKRSEIKDRAVKNAAGKKKSFIEVFQKNKSEKN